MDEQLYELAHKLGAELKARQLKLVLAESCTGGMAAAALTDVPGISAHFCGSMVTYRDATKADWLGVSRDVLANPKLGAVSPVVAEEMCLGALDRTSEADLAAAITGHLGPDAPAGLDGTIYIGVAWRSGSPPLIQRRTLTEVLRTSRSPRHARQRQATEILLVAVLKVLTSSETSPAAI